VSQIDDDEMARMNVEISAALAWWFGLCGASDRQYFDLVQRAIAYLPVGPKTIRPHPQADTLLACTMPEMAAEVRRTWRADQLDQDQSTAGNHGIRVIANTVTLKAWRNGPIEGVHAGCFQGYGLEERRVSAKAEKAIVRHAQGGVFGGIKVVDYLRYDKAWPPPADRVLPFLHGLVGPAGWSLTEESRIKALDYGLARVAGSMAKAEPSAKQLMVSVENLYDMTKERLGEPLMNELVPILKQVKEEWAGAIPDVEKFAKVMAHDLGDAPELIAVGDQTVRHRARRSHPPRHPT